MKFLKIKASAAVLGISLLGALAASPAAHAAPGRCGYQGGHPIQRPGNRSAAVLHAQCLLKHYNGFGSQGTTGFFGGQTAENVRTFQERKGLVQDGVIGPNTWKRLHP